MLIELERAGREQGVQEEDKSTKCLVFGSCNILMK